MMDENIQAVNGDTLEYTAQTAPEAEVTKKKNGVRFPFAPVLSLLAILAIFTAQTFAFFTDSQSADSAQIIPGALDISLIEVNSGGSFRHSAEPIKMMPAGVYSYGGVGAKNTGTLPVYIRIKIQKNIIQSEHEISPGWESLIDCNFGASNESLPEEQRNLWVYHEGYYYYKVALAPGEQTTALFDKVLFSPGMGNEFENSSIEFHVICESVQSGNNAPDPFTAWGWPATSGIAE